MQQLLVLLHFPPEQTSVKKNKLKHFKLPKHTQALQDDTFSTDALEICSLKIFETHTYLVVSSTYLDEKETFVVFLNILFFCFGATPVTLSGYS